MPVVRPMGLVDENKQSKSQCAPVCSACLADGSNLHLSEKGLAL